VIRVWDTICDLLHEVTVGIVEKGSCEGGATKESYRVRTWEMSYRDQSKRNLRVENAGFSSGYN